MEKDKKVIHAVVVLYNRRCEDSLTLKCIEGLGSFVSVVICDNSIKDYKNEEYAKAKGCSYLSMKGNRGLAVAYNSAVNYLINKDGFICLFDDDTIIPADYFLKLQDSILKTQADIYLPVLYDDVGILSPSEIRGVFVKRVKDVKSLHKRNITGINSAMAINLDIFKEGYRYDEGYFLDYIDHEFLRTMKRLGKKIEILDVKLKQNFSGSVFFDKEKCLKRFGVYKKDFRKFCRGFFLGEFFAFLVIIKRLLNLTIKFRTLDFLLK